MIEKCYRISGRVQGVGFRFWAVRTVVSVGGISGYIGNLLDGDVLILLAGEEDKINTIKQHLYQGPLFARVDRITDTPELKSYFPPIENGVLKRI